MERRDLGRQLLGRLDELRGNILPRKEIRSGYRVLAYRRFWPPAPGLKQAFEAQLDYLRKNYAVASLPELVQDLCIGQAPADNTICITVDGGHKDFFSVAYPALRDRGMQATVFLPTGFIDGGVWLWFDRVIHAVRNTRASRIDAGFPGQLPGSFSLEGPNERRVASRHLLQSLQAMPSYERDPLMNQILEQLGMIYPPYPPQEFAALTWDEISEMWPNHISFGAQTVTHSTLTSLPGEGEIHAEMAGAKQRIEHQLGVECSLFCYPGGAFNDRVVDIAKNCGFRGAVTNQPGPNTIAGDRFRIQRVSVEPTLPLNQFAERCKEKS